MAGKTIAYLNVLLGGNSSQLNKTLNTAEKDIKRFGGNLERIGSNLSLKVTAPLTAIGYISTQTASKFSDSLLKVQALSNATGREFELLEGKAKELGATTRFSANQVADAMGYMALAGYNTNQTLLATPAILSLASSAQTDLATTSDIVTDTMSAFKIQAQEATKVSDLFAQAQSKSNTNVLQLGEAFKYVAPNFASANQSIEDTTTLLSVLANSGFKGSIAGTALNAMLKDLIKNSNDGAIAVGNNTVAIYDSNGVMRSTIDILTDIESATKKMTQAQKDMALGALFEERSIRAVNIILNSGTKELRRYQELMNSSTGVAEKMANQMESGLGGSIRKLNSSLESIQIIIGDNLAPIITSFANVIQSTAQWLNSLDSGTQKTIVSIGLFATVLPPVIYGLGGIMKMGVAVIGKMKLLTTTFATGTGVVGTFGTTLSTVILPITATIAALYGLYKAGEYFNKNSKINQRVTAELNIITKQSNTIKKKALEVGNDLNEKIKTFNKLSDEEKKKIIASTEAKILDLETTLKQQKALAQLTAKKAMELTLWEKFTSYVFSFGNTAGTAYKMAEKSGEKYIEVIEKSNESIKSTEYEIENLRTLLNQISNQELSPLDQNLENLKTISEKTKKILSDLSTELKRISISKEIDKGFNNIDSRVTLLKNALIDLRMNGVSPLSKEYINLKRKFDQAVDTQSLNNLQNKLNDLTNKPYTIELQVGNEKIETNIGSGFNNSFNEYINERGKKLFEANMKMANQNKSMMDKMLQDQSNFDQQFALQWGGTVQSFTIDTIGSFAEAFGGLILNGKRGIEQFAGSILSSFGKFLVQMGKMGLVYSKFALKIKSAFANPAVGIGASLALIAIGGAMSAFASQINSSVGGGGGYSSNTGITPQSFNPDFLNSRGIGKVEFEIKGDKLVGVLDNYNRFKRRF